MGAAKYNPNPSAVKHRKACVAEVKNREAQKHWPHARDLGLQGMWTKWFDSTFPLDFTWKTLLYGPGKSIIKLLLNASINARPTPDLRKLCWYSYKPLALYVATNNALTP